jgi:hypothetical protein
MIIENDLSGLWSEFEQQAINSPGGDEVIAACFGAVSEMARGDYPWVQEFGDVMRERKIGQKHGVNLFFRAIQFVLTFEEKDENYPEQYKERDYWMERLPDIWEKHGTRIIRILKERDTGTTIFQRYAGPKAILAAKWPGNTLNVIDLGCGGNHGLPGLISGEKFKPIKDNSDKKLVSRWIKKPIEIGNSVGLDKNDPYDAEVARWRLACSFYPKELSDMKKFLRFEEKLRSIGEEIFLKGDIRELEYLIPKGLKFDAVILSTVLYQMDEANRKKTIDEATKLLNENGLVIIQDFAKKNGTIGKLDFDGSWFKEKSGYRTFVLGSQTKGEMWEVLKWNNGRCREVEEGEDFGKFFGILNI